jgi:hypothetical protein
LPGSGIVYVLTVAETERLTAFLVDQGLDVAAYSGQSDDREALEGRLLRNQIKALVATSALGMGYDKPDLAFCIHLGSPASPVAYYQQVGRAGRALDDAIAVLVPGPPDERIWEYFATSGIPTDEQRPGRPESAAVRTLLGVRWAPAGAGRASQLGAGGGGTVFFPRARRRDRAAEALGQRPSRPQGQDRRRGAGPRAGFRRRPGLG